MEINERARAIINQLIYDHFAENIGDLATKLGYNPSVLSGMLSGRLPLSNKFAKALCDADERFNLDWLLNEEGEMMFKPKKKKAQAKECQKGSPYYPELKVSAGQMDFFDYNDTSENMYVPNVEVQAYFPVTGCSMAPTIMPGDIIGVKDVLSYDYIDPANVYMIITKDHERMIKHIMPTTNEEEEITLTSDNPSYPPFQIPKESVLKVFKVTFVGKTL